MKRLRRLMLEIWVLFPLAIIVGFMGPFGTYLTGDIFARTSRWWLLLTGAYIVARPIMEFWRWIGRVTGLPQGSLVFWGLIGSSFPLAFLWRVEGGEDMRLLGGYSGLLPFTLLCSLMTMVVAWWAERADAYLLHYYQDNISREPIGALAGGNGGRGEVSFAQNRPVLGTSVSTMSSSRSKLYARLSPQFTGDILALESEDHYVRVHGMRSSELLLMRLRDAIAEMNEGLGEQTHRSWWVARDAVAEVVGTARKSQIRLINGTRALVARDSIERLQRENFLPA